jgi:DNA-binding LacI/PurR family transcriptional regulator
MKVEKELMGKIAVRKLLERIENGTEISEKILLTASLVKRESVNQVVNNNFILDGIRN